MNMAQSAPLVFFRQLGQKNYREYLRLLVHYGNMKRYLTRDIKFLEYNIRVADCLSFIFQFKDIFVKQSYKFATESDSPVIYDCGANIGIGCIYFKHLYPKSHVTAFEADPAIAEILKTNLARNSITDVEVIPKAVWINQNGVTFMPDGADGGSINESSGGIRVPTIRLRDYLTAGKTIDLLKIDIEGAEVPVLEDCGDALKTVQNLFVEYHSWHGQRQQLDRLLSIITKAGFHYYLEPVTAIGHPLENGKTLQSINIQINIFAVRE
jgi:FkbM family methyltransferase